VSAIGLCAVIIWGYFYECLPPDVLSPTNHYALEVLRKRSRPFVETDLRFKPSLKQTRRSQVITGFVKVLSDQQLITGTAILIAGLASRCSISIYEFNIITYFAYFAEITHQISLGVLQGYLYDHKIVRECRVVFTVGFLIIFGFSFVINTASLYMDSVIDPSTLNVGNAVQCIFEAPKLGKYVQFDTKESVVILGLIILGHTAAIVNLYLGPDTILLEELIRLFWVRCVRMKGLPKSEATTLVSRATLKCYVWSRPLLPESGKTCISIWFFLDGYNNAYLSVLPNILLGLCFGIGSIVLAIWFGGLKPSNGLQILGFGQIVAIVLLALTLLAAIEIVNGE
jgi:hypothetical protein